MPKAKPLSYAQKLKNTKKPTSAEKRKAIVAMIKRDLKDMTLPQLLRAKHRVAATLFNLDIKQPS